MKYENGDLIRIVKFLPGFYVPPEVEVGQIRSSMIGISEDRVLVELRPEVWYVLFHDEIELYYRPKKEVE